MNGLTGLAGVRYAFCGHSVVSGGEVCSDWPILGQMSAPGAATSGWRCRVFWEHGPSKGKKINVVGGETIWRKRARLARQNQRWNVPFSSGSKHRKNSLVSSFTHLFTSLPYALIHSNTKHLLEHYVRSWSFSWFRVKKRFLLLQLHFAHTLLPPLEKLLTPLASQQQLLGNFKPMTTPVEQSVLFETSSNGQISQ